jgi:ribonuclease D
LQLAIDDAEYVIHAASQDLAGLREHGLNPARLFDTELAGRLLGYPRVALGVLTAELLGFRLAKEHSAEDWSTRPLPSSWLRYAALDVELLLELRDALALRLEAAGKLEWALQEFAHVLHQPPAAPNPEPWRRTIGLGSIRDPRQLAVARSLWEAREALAKTRDIAPKRLLSDRAILAAAWELPSNVGRLMGIREFSDSANRRRARSWRHAIDSALALPEAELPTSRGPGTGGPPNPREWERRRPEAAARLTAAKAVLTQLSEQWDVPAENLLLPDALKRLCWEPPRQSTKATIAEALEKYQARPWQVGLLAAPLAKAFKRK